MSTQTCDVPSVVSTEITIGYGCCYLCFILVAAGVGFNDLRKAGEIFIKSKGDFVMKFLKTFHHKKSCYGPLLAHFMDKATDVAVVYQFWKLGSKERDLKTDTFDLCLHMNVWYLFLLSVGVLVLYHIASSSLIWYYTGNWKRFFTQMLDLELLYALYINYILHKEVLQSIA